MAHSTLHKLWIITQRYVLNKYLIAFLVFAVMFMFCGENSLIQRTQRNQQIRAMQAELDAAEKEIEKRKQDIEAIQGKPEQLERFARETYYMHADNEEVYLIEEDE